MARSVLILGARAPVALDHARRFAHQGWRVFVADSIPCRISGTSRVVQAALRIASPRHAPTRFVADLQDIVSTHAIDLIVPTCEEVFFVSRYRDRLAAHVRVLSDDFGKLREVHGKRQFLSHADGCGAHVPEATLVTSLGQAREWAGIRGVVLKPEFSRFGVHVRLYPGGIPADAPPLAALGKWVVQEYAEGQEFCSYSTADAGQLLAHSLYRPAWRMSLSSSFYFEAARNDAIRAFAARFARKLSFTGQLSFDWIVRADGRASVLECNPRSTSGCHLFSLDDPLPAALDGTLQHCVEPSSDAPRMIAAMMATAGLWQGIRRRELGRWMRDYRAATDVIGMTGDHGPTFGAISDLVSYARLALAQRRTLREAATQDIEWNGQELPEA